MSHDCATCCSEVLLLLSRVVQCRNHSGSQLLTAPCLHNCTKPPGICGPTTNSDDCIRHSWDWKVLPNSHRVRVAAPTGVAAFNIDGHTVHSLLNLPSKADFKDLEGEYLHQMQQSLANMQYLFIDEMSIIGRKIFGQVEKCLCQVLPHKADHLFGGCSCLLFGDFA